MANEPCPECGSSDAMESYEDGTYCFSCNTKTFSDAPKEKPKVTSSILPEGSYSRPIASRNLSVATLKHYGVSLGATKERKSHYYPYHTAEGKKIGVKERMVEIKDFTAHGNVSAAVMFGQHLFPKGSAKFVTICEGELDAMSAFQMMGSKFPFISLKNGATGAFKDCQRSFEYLESFPTIVLCFDSDAPGRKAAKEVADLFTPGKVKIVTLTKGKDASDYLVNNTLSAFATEWWNAEDYRPDGIVSIQELRQEVLDNREVKSIPYPWEGMNTLSYGIRPREMITYVAGSGIAKSTVLNQIGYHLWNTTTDNIGFMRLEGAAVTSIKLLASIHGNCPFFLPDAVYTEETYVKAVDEITEGNRFHFFSRHGSSNIDSMVSLARYMAKGLNCRHLILDHINIVVSDQRNNDERKALDEIATKLRALVEETDISLHVICHTRRQSGVPHEEGAPVSLSDIRGTAGIGQLSDIVWGMERNGQHEDMEIRNTTHIRCLKNRFCGRTGSASYVHYDENNQSLTEVPPVDIIKKKEEF